MHVFSVSFSILGQFSFQWFSGWRRTIWFPLTCTQRYQKGPYYGTRRYWTPNHPAPHRNPQKYTKIASFRIFSIMVFRSISSSFWIPGKDSPGMASTIPHPHCRFWSNVMTQKRTGCSFSVYPKGLGWFWVRTSNDHQRSSNIFHPKVGKKSSSEPHLTDPTVLFGTRPWPVWLSSLPRDSWFPFMKGSTRQLGSGISTGPSSCGMFAQTTDHMTQIETPKETKIQQISTDDPHRS